MTDDIQVLHGSGLQPGQAGGAQLDAAPAPHSGRAVAPPQSWAQPQNHLEALLSSTWYEHAVTLLDTVNFAAHEFFRDYGARFAAVPVTTGAISSPMGLGSDSEPVLATIAGRDVFLADSMQFMLELIARIGGKPAYYIMPSFRGEQADARHLNQFFHAEIELPGSLDDVMACGEGLVRSLVRALLDRARDAVLALGGTADHLEALAVRDAPFPRISFARAVDELEGVAGAFEERGGTRTITPAGERDLIARHGDFVWLTHLPRRTVPFYQAVSAADPQYSEAADLLAGLGEILGCGERARTIEDVTDNLAFCGVDPASYDWYCDMKRRQPIRTSGFGLGIERFLMWATRTHDIRDWALLLRDRHGLGSP